MLPRSCVRLMLVRMRRPPNAVLGCALGGAGAAQVMAGFDAVPTFWQLLWLLVTAGTAGLAGSWALLDNKKNPALL